MAVPAWLLELTGRRLYRVATRQVDLADGTAYAPGLSTNGIFDDVLSFDVPAERSVSFSLDLQDAGLSIEEVGDIAYGATASLYYYDGTADPLLVLSGTVEEPEWGALDEPLTATVAERPWDDRTRMPDREAAFNDDTWPLRDTDAGFDGNLYPMVIGRPGLTDVMGSPAFYVKIGATDYLVLAGHPTVAGGTVTLHDKVNGGSASLTVLQIQDGLGRWVAAAISSVTYTVFPSLTTGGAMWAVWDNAYGALLPEDPSKPLRGAGDVIDYMLSRSTLRVDQGRVRAARQRLNAFLLDCYIQPSPGQSVSPWEWLQAHVLPLLPVVVRVGPLGLYVAAFDIFARTVDCGAVLEAGRNCVRISPVSALGTSDRVNDVRLHYAPRADLGSYASTVRAVGDSGEAGSSVFVSQACRESAARFGSRQAEYRTEVIYDDETASKIVRFIAARDAMPAREVAYELTEDVPGLEVGQPVLLTDAAVGMSGAVAHVWLLRQGDRKEVVLRLHWSAGR